MRSSCAVLLGTLVIASACDAAPSTLSPPEARGPDSSGVDPRGAAPAIEPARGALLGDDERMTLRLPRPGAARADVLARVPECAAHLDGARCRFHGWIRPLPRPCEDGCTWWTYRFADDRLDVAELERSVWDVDSEFAAVFRRDAHRVADELSRRLGIRPQVDHLGEWDTVENSARGTDLLERRVWELDDVLVTWTLRGHAGHHPGVSLDVRAEAPRLAALRVEMLAPARTTGAPLLRLRGGPLARPRDLPLWLSVAPDDEEAERCSLFHDALAFPLPDGRLYVGQYNAVCGGRTCRVLDPASGELAVPPGGCLFGEGLHHRAEAIGGGHVLLTSDAEGTGTIEIVRYDASRGSEVVLSLSLSPMAPLHARVRDGGVDFDTVCALPPGCELREYGEVPSRRYRWTSERGLVEN